MRENCPSQLEFAFLCITQSINQNLKQTNEMRTKSYCPSSGLCDDGIILPTETRKCLSMGQRQAFEKNQIAEMNYGRRGSYGIFRM